MSTTLYGSDSTKQSAACFVLPIPCRMKTKDQRKGYAEMTPTPGGQPKPQSSQQPGNEPGGANGMYGRFGQTPGQQPSQGFRQKVDGVRRGFGGQRQQRGGMRQASGMGQMQNNSQGDSVGFNGQPVDRSQGQGREAYSQQLRSIQQPQGQPGQSSYRSSGQYDRDRAGGMQDDGVAERETEFNSDPRYAQAAAMGNQRLAQQPMQQDQPDYGRFAPGPAAGAMEARSYQQPMNDAAPVGAMENTQYMGSSQPMPTATTTQAQPSAQPSVAPVQNTQNMGGQQSPPVAQTTQATPAPSGFASPFGMMRFGAPPAQPEQPKADDMQPRDTFQTGPSSLQQPMSSLEGQSRRRQRDRFGYGA
jgi:hypothetical protein